MAFGPIDIIALEFKDNHIDGEILADLTEMVSMEVIRILDLVIVKKNERGEVTILELHELDPEITRMLAPLKAEISGLITIDDIKLIAGRIMNNTTAVVMLFENLWAVRVKQDITFAGGRLVMHERIPQEVVIEALEDLANYDLP